MTSRYKTSPLSDWADRLGLERGLRKTLKAVGAPEVSDLTFRKQSHNAVVYQAVCDDAAVFIKHYQTDYGPRLVRNTVEETAIVQHQMAGGTGGVVDVIWASEEAALVVMSAAKGHPLTDDLGGAEAAQAMQDVAGWLRRYVGPRLFEDAFSTSYWLKQRKAMDVSPLSKSDRVLVARAIDVQGERAATLGTVPVWKGRLPKDFAPHNLHRDKGAIWGFDVEGYTTAALSRVYVNFCVLVERWLPTTEMRLHGLQSRAIVPFLDAFEGYTDVPELLEYQATDLVLARFVSRNAQEDTAKRLRFVLKQMVGTD